MSKVSVKVRGAKEGIARAKEAMKNIEAGNLEAQKHVAEETRKEAYQRAPYDTGVLRDSIAVVEDDENTLAVATDVFYAEFMEFGTRYGIEPRPFMLPAFEAKRGEYVKRAAKMKVL